MGVSSEDRILESPQTVQSEGGVQTPADPRFSSPVVSDGEPFPMPTSQQPEMQRSQEVTPSQVVDKQTAPQGEPAAQPYQEGKHRVRVKKRKTMPSENTT